MAEDKKTYIYEIIVDTKQGTASINGQAVALDSLDSRLRQIKKSADSATKSMGQMASKSGLAGAAVVEIGRTISDANYGMFAMANNLQQVSTLMVTLIATTGGVAAGFRALYAAMMGPLGIIVVLQIAIAAIERFSLENRNAKESVDALTKSIDDQTSSFRRLSSAAFESFYGEEGIDLVNALRKEFKEFDNAYSALTDKQKGEMTTVMGLTNRYLELLGVRREIMLTEEKLSKGDFASGVEKLAAEKELIQLKIQEYQLGLTFEKKKEQKEAASKKGGKQKGLFGLASRPMAGSIQAITQSGIDISDELRQKQIEVNLEAALNKAQIENEEEKNEELKRLRELDLEHRTQTLEAIGAGMQSLGYLIGEQTEAGKAIAAAGALIDTFAAANAILKNAAKTPAGGIPGYAIAQAGAAIVFGLAQVKKIYDVKVPKGKGKGGSAGAAPQVTEQAPNFNIVGDTGQNQIRRTIEDALGKPTKAYITTKDVRTAAELDRNIVKTASVG